MLFIITFLAVPCLENQRSVCTSRWRALYDDEDDADFVEVNKNATPRKPTIPKIFNSGHYQRRIYSAEWMRHDIINAFISLIAPAESYDTVALYTLPLIIIYLSIFSMEYIPYFHLKMIILISSFRDNDGLDTL